MRHPRWLPWALLGLLAAVAFHGCGYDVCIGPFGGDCYSQDSASSTTSGVLAITSPKTALSQNEVMTFTVTGGVPPYTFRNPSHGTISATGVYTAPAESNIAVRIEVEDFANTIAATAITIN